MGGAVSERCDDLRGLAAFPRPSNVVETPHGHRNAGWIARSSLHRKTRVYDITPGRLYVGGAAAGDSSVKNRSRTSGVGTMHSSFFPNQRYRLRANQS